MPRRIAIAAAAAAVALGATIEARAAERPVMSAAFPAAATERPRLSAAETAFMRSVRLENTANAVTSDLLDYAGTRVALRCTIETIVQKDVMIGQCGKDVEPVDLYLEAATAHRRRGDILRVLGTVDPPIGWTDVWGHTVYYPFIRARFVDVLGYTPNPDE